MKKSSIEITDQEYLIKLNRSDFDISFINRLLNHIQSGQYLSGSKKLSEAYQTIDTPSNDYISNRFDSLRDK